MMRLKRKPGQTHLLLMVAMLFALALTPLNAYALADGAEPVEAAELTQSTVDESGSEVSVVSDDLGEPADDSSPDVLGTEIQDSLEASSADVLASEGEAAECPGEEHSAVKPGDAETVVEAVDGIEPEVEDGATEPQPEYESEEIAEASASGLSEAAPFAARQPTAEASGSGRWEVTNKRGHGMQRYWIEADGSIAKSRLIDPAEGSGWWAYARPEGYVVRGKYVAKDGKVYLANNDGKLERPGWLVTKAYDGRNERYWIDSEAHAAVPGYSEDGWWHYTIPGKGYVARGSFSDSEGRSGQANNEGVVSTPISPSKMKSFNGWVVTNAFGHGLQRYWFRHGVMATSELLSASESGWWAYARPEGYVARGKYVARDGKVYLANNDGRLENPGWVVTNKYDGGFQRYWIDDEAHAAVPGYSSNGWAHYTLPNKGYVARGKANVGGYMVFADNNGKLTNESDGWLITVKYDGGLQRYWIENCGAYTAAKLGAFSVGGKQYYGREDRGFVVRGFYCAPNGNAVFADNDGVCHQLPTLSKRIQAACKAVPSPGAGLCSEWVSEVIERITGTRYYGDADDMFYEWCNSRDFRKLVPGMAIAVPTHGHTYLGGIYGHICIYIGGNQIMDNVGYIRTMSLGEWLAWYGDRREPQWGWIGGKAI